MSTLSEQLTESETKALEAMKTGQPYDDGGEPVEPAEAPAEAVEPAEPAAEPEAAEEPAEASQEAEGEQPEAERTVPHKALHAERQARKEAERKLAEFEQRMRELEKEKEKEKEKEPEPKPEPWPDPVVEPEKYAQRMQQELQKRDEQIQQLRQGTDEQRQQAEMAQRVQVAEQQFREQAPDYDEAVQFLADARRKEHALFIGNDEMKLRQAQAQDVQALIQAAFQQGRNPAELAYEYAKARGYAPKAQQQEQPAPKVDETKRMEALANAQRQTQSLGNAPGGEQGGRPTMQQLAEEPEPETIAGYRGAKTSRNDSDLRRVLGG